MGCTVQNFGKLVFSFFLVVGAILIAGCGSGPDVAGMVAENNKTNMQKIANVMMLYQNRVGRAANSEDELVGFVTSHDKIDKNLNFMKIDKDSFGDYFVSERDQQPYFVRYGIVVPDRTPAQAFVFETVGVDGVRKVAWSDSSVTDVSDEKEYKKLKDGKVKRMKPKEEGAAAAKAAADAAEGK